MKKKKKTARKHLLFVKSTDNTHKATEKKNEISSALKGLQIMDAKFKQICNVILNFESEHQRDEAAAKVEKLENLSANKTKMLFPKIMICNVSKEENRDDIVQTKAKRNDYLKSTENITDKLSLTFAKEVA